MEAGMAEAYRQYMSKNRGNEIMQVTMVWMAGNRNVYGMYMSVAGVILVV